jgi:putative ABC transport system ATP-binding protein
MSKLSSLLVTATHVYKSVRSGGSDLIILEDINLQIHEGETVAILGSSGSGKTTLLSLLAGLDLPSAGTIRIRDHVISNMSEDQRAQVRNKKIGIIFQTFELIPSLTAVENVLMPLELSGFHSSDKIAIEWLKKVGLQHRIHHYPAQLSGGEQQRVGIARAFALSPELLFADEPTGNLDQQSADPVIQLLHELNEEHNTTMVIVTHDQPLAQSCSVQYHIEAGRLL